MPAHKKKISLKHFKRFLERKPKYKTVHCFIHIGQWLAGGNATDISLPPLSMFTLIIDYPINGEVKFQFYTGTNGLGFAGLMNKISHFYQKIYDNEDKYGVYGHDITDLNITKINVSFKTNTIRLEVGS